MQYRWLWLLLLASCASSGLAPSPPGIPPACQSSCITPFGEKLGSTKNGIVSYSNCKPACVFEIPSNVNGVYAGIQWQCVEFARRWLIQNRGVSFKSIDFAGDLWALPNAFFRVDQKPMPAVATFANGAKQIPKVGDLLVYAKEFLGTGHLAVVLEVDPKNAWLRVGEENFSNLPWAHNYAREIPVVKRGEGFWVLDAYLLGWKAF